MPRLSTTVGQLLVNDVLPEDMRDYSRTLDKKALTDLLSEVAKRYPDRYREISHGLARVGRTVAYATGGFSFGLKHLRTSPAALAVRQKLQKELEAIADDDKLTDEQRARKILLAVGRASDGLQAKIYEESLAEGNPLAKQILSGARGNPGNLASLRGADFLYTDHRGKVLPLPVLHSYSEGLSPAEYWAGTYGARKGTMDTKFCIFSKELVLMADYTEKAIEDVRRGDWVMGSDRRGNLLPVRVVEVWNNGERPCYRYRFRKGSCRDESSFRELVATEEHRVLAQIRAGQPGATYAKHSTYEPTPLPLGKAACRKDPTKNWFVAWPARGERGCLDRADEPRALLAGLMLGDGCMAPSTRGQYGLSCADPQLLDDVEGYLAQFNLALRRRCQADSQYLYGLVSIEPEKRRTEVVNGKNSFVPGHHNQTKSWLKYTLGEKLAHEKTMPDDVWTWNDRSLADFLGGIFATDGGVEARKDGCSITLTMTSCEVVTQVQRLLELRLGIWTSSLRRIPKEQLDNAKHDQYEVTISHPECVRRFAERITLVGCKRQELAQALANCSTKPQQSEYGFKIHSKEFLGSRPVYDLEVDHPDHLYCLANGIIVHNSTQDAGYLSKQLNQIAHRAVVVDLDGDGEPDTLRGYPVDTTDPDNEGALLAAPAGGYARNTVLTPKILSDLRQQKVGRILVRSPLVGGTPDGGVYARDVGVREFGRLPVAGENVGLTAAQALSEPLSQAQLSSKHNGGVASSSANRATGGFQLINQLIQTPKTFKGGAAHATLDGTVEHITDAPAGGKFVQINGNQHYVAPDFELRVKRGDKVEAGDVISEGIPNPSVIVRYKGIGEGRRYFVNAFRQAFRDAGIKGHRRNMELLAKGLINHVRLTDEIGDYAPDDIVPYSAIEANYQPRQGFKAAAPAASLNQYLEKPYLHYSIGTKVRPSMLKDFQEFGINEVVTHPDPPPFEPEMIRGMANMQHDPDWITRMLGSGQKSSLLDAVHRGAYSDETGTSFVPSLAKTINFGQSGKVQTPKPNANDDQMRMSKTFKVGEDLLTKQARELIAKIKEAEELTPYQQWVQDFYANKKQEDQRYIDESLAAVQKRVDAKPQAPVDPNRAAKIRAIQHLYGLAQRGDDELRRKMQDFQSHYDKWNQGPGGWINSATDLMAIKTVAQNVPSMPLRDLEGNEYPNTGFIYQDPEAYGYKYEAPEVASGLPEGANPEDYVLPNITEDGSIPTRDRWGLWLWNGRGGWYSEPDYGHPQNAINAYNEAIRQGKSFRFADVSGSGGPDLQSIYSQIKSTTDPALWDEAVKGYWTPDKVWLHATPAEREKFLRDNYAPGEGEDWAVSPAELAKLDEMPDHAKALYPDHYKDITPTQPLFRQRDYDGMVPYTAPSEVRMSGTPDQVNQAAIDSMPATPQWNDDPGYQPSGYGLLPLAQMVEQVAPGTVNNMLQFTGPVGMGSLVDVGAVSQLVKGPARSSSPAPPPPPPAPAPGAPPKVPMPGSPAPKPAPPAMPKAPTPMSPPKPRSGMPPTPASPLPKPASPVPGG